MSKSEAPKEAPEGEGEGEEGAKKKPPLMILIAAGVGALVIIGGGVTTFLIMSGGHKTEAAKDEKDKKGEKPAKKDDKKEGEKGKDKGPNPISAGPDGVVYYTLPDMVANIQSADGRPSLLKIKVALEFKDESTAEDVTASVPRLTDMLQGFMRELRPEDISGSQGEYQIRLEILRRVNLVLAPTKANAVLIEEMLVT